MVHPPATIDEGNVSKAADDLLKAMRVTAGCRFDAAKRLQFHDRQLTWLTALSSAYLILLTVLPYFFKLPTEAADTLNAFTVFYSVVILVSSLIQYSTGDVVNAEQHHRSALEINELWREFKIGVDGASSQEVRSYTER
jgi:preprotein translocase subunit SecY